MRENLDRTKGFIMAQRVAFALSPALGKDEADELVRSIIHKAMSEKLDFRTASLKDPTASRLLAPAKVDELLQPEGYLGLVREDVDAVIAHVAEAVRSASWCSDRQRPVKGSHPRFPRESAVDPRRKRSHRS